MKKFLIIALSLIGSTLCSLYAQNVVREGNVFMPTTKETKAKPASTDTGFMYNYKGVNYPVMQGAKGGLYIIIGKREDGTDIKVYLINIDKPVYLEIKKLLEQKK